MCSGRGAMSITKVHATLVRGRRGGEKGVYVHFEFNFRLQSGSCVSHMIRVWFRHLVSVFVLQKPSTAHRPLVDRSSTAHRPLVKTASTAFLDRRILDCVILYLFNIQDMRAMQFLLVGDERWMSGRRAVDERSLVVVTRFRSFVYSARNFSRYRKAAETLQ